MSFTTRCPSCGTMFRVVADQLKISEGWVRCGHCADVFDATLYLQPWIPPGEEQPAAEEYVAAAPEPVHEPVHEPEPEVDLDRELEEALSPTSPPEAVPDSPPDEPMWGPSEIVMDQGVIDTAPPPYSLPPAPGGGAVADDAESDFQAELQRFAAGLGRLKEGGAGAALVETTTAEVDGSSIPQAPAPQDARDVDPPVSESDGQDTVPGFVRQAQRQAFWASRGMRVSLALLGLTLATLLAAQWALHERDRLAAWRPELRPMLQQACGHLGCTLAPVRRIDAIVIDSTSLVRRLGNFYSFDLVLKNTASMELAVPALELSLTDTGGSVISRRVFLPAEWPDAPALLPAQASVTVSFRLSLALGDETPMAGYHALVFYP